MVYNGIAESVLGVDGDVVRVLFELIYVLYLLCWVHVLKALL